MKYFIFLCLIFSSLAFSNTTRYGLGDVNNDDQINVLDILQVINIVVGNNTSPTEYQLWASDVNIDGNIDVLDVVLLVNVILGTGDLPPDIQRILFIGNSYTYYNSGLGTHVAELANHEHDTWEIYTEQIVQGGATLEMHFNNENTISTISAGNWDVVVLQEQSTRPIDQPDLFYDYAALLDSVISASGAETSFFMTWARQNDPGMITGLSEAYSNMGLALEAIVAPVGLAFENVRLTDPGFNLYDIDGSHPNSAGTYLAACVFYAVLWEQSPVGAIYPGPYNLPGEDIYFLQNIAWQTVQDYTHN